MRGAAVHRARKLAYTYKEIEIANAAFLSGVLATRGKPAPVPTWGLRGKAACPKSAPATAPQASGAFKPPAIPHGC